MPGGMCICGLGPAINSGPGLIRCSGLVLVGLAGGLDCSRRNGELGWISNGWLVLHKSRSCLSFVQH